MRFRQNIKRRRKRRIKNRNLRKRKKERKSKAGWGDAAAIDKLLVCQRSRTSEGSQHIDQFLCDRQVIQIATAAATTFQVVFTETFDLANRKPD